MATSLIFLLLIIITLSSPKTLIFANSNTTTIETTCKTTHYYNLCVSSLKSDPRSHNADTKGLAAIMIGFGMKYAATTATFLAGNLTSTAVKNDEKISKNILKDCSDKYNLACDSLGLAIKDLDDDNYYGYDYAYMHVMGAVEYSNVCRNSFRRVNGLIYTAEICRREENFKSICGVVLGILDKLVE